MTASAREPMTLAEFVAWEQRQEWKHELVEGRVSALPGVTLRHNKLAGAIFRVLSTALLDGPYSAFISDVTIATPTGFRYPDVVVSGDEIDDVPDTRALRHPKLIVEVLSQSTANEDLGPKLREYQAFDSLEEYLMVDSRKRWAQLMRRTNGDWILAVSVSGGPLELRSVGVTLDIDALYAEARIPRDPSTSSG